LGFGQYADERMIVAKSNGVKPGTDLAESSAEEYCSKSAVVRWWWWWWWWFVTDALFDSEWWRRGCVGCITYFPDSFTASIFGTHAPIPPTCSATIQKHCSRYNWACSLYCSRGHMPCLAHGLNDCRFVFGGLQPHSLAAASNYLHVWNFAYIDVLGAGWLRYESTAPGRYKRFSLDSIQTSSNPFHNLIFHR
jgi:hypothetical protein